MNFLLPFQPNNTATLLDNSTHWLRSAIHFKWSIAELEMYRIRVTLIGDSKQGKAYIGRDIEALWKARKNTRMRPLKNELTDVHNAYLNIRDDRNTLVHGNIEFPDPSTDLHVPDARFPAVGQRSRFHKPGRAVMTKEGREVPQNADALREVNGKAEQLLQAIYAMWLAIDPRFKGESNRRIYNASDPGIGFGPNGEKTDRVQFEFNLSDVLKHEGISNYVCNVCGWRCVANPSQEPTHCDTLMVPFTWKECPECDIVAIENGPACWHMILAEYYENGEPPFAFTVRLSGVKAVLEQAISEGADDLILEIPIISSGQSQVRHTWVKAPMSPD